MDDLIRRAREALVDVTPGPWKEFIDDSSGQWTGWPLSIDATSIEDKCVVRTGGQWPYEWDAKTSQHEACANARFIAAARDLVPALADRLEAQEALLREAMAALHQYISDMRYPPERDSRDRRIAWARATLAKMRAHLGGDEMTIDHDKIAALVHRADSWDRCYPGNLNVEVLVADLTKAARALYDEVKRLRAALTIYAQSGNWRLGGCCDPNSPNFTGEAIARAALKGDSDE